MLNELLTESAPLALSWSRRFCSGGAGDAGCADYHGLRQYWRILDLVTTPTHHRFFEQALCGPVGAGGRLDVLISGCADYAQLAQLLELWKRRRGGRRVTVVDRCETPLALCRWYARREGVSIETRRADIREYSPAKRFDLIITHSFLSWFKSEDRSRVIARWYGLLRPGGCVLTINRLRPPKEDVLAAPNGNRETEAFCEQVRERWTRVQPLVDVSIDQFVDWARQYRRAYKTPGIRSARDLEKGFTDAGFETSVTRLVAPERKEWRQNSDETGPVRYVGVTATRPG